MGETLPPHIFCMNVNRYKYAIVDLSYVLNRNLRAISSVKPGGEYSVGDVMRTTIQTLNKMARDYGITADKIILGCDLWSQKYGGYYRTHCLKGDYKSSRKYVTPKDLVEKKKDPAVKKEELVQMENEIFFNMVRKEAKIAITKNFSRIGLPCAGIDGWEFDDLAYFAGRELFKLDNKPSVVVTKDTDVLYSITPKMDYFKIPTGKNDTPQIRKYEEVYKSLVPEEIRNKNIGLYHYKALLDSLGGGHNDMKRTSESKDFNSIISKIADGDFSGVRDREVFNIQFNSFNLDKFPGIEDAKKLIADGFPTMGHIDENLEAFREICDRFGVKGISDDYFSKFIFRFDKSLFKE